ncbi:hypothetical protein GCM10022403_006560 [Streptomyces coacervatus]|uniref:Transposase n=1 Tax=Streptomyces coacervatus TaxID=647381 RepID=A0ABP7GUA3_9ACTN|nr:hypothetical protein [Streptomyces coacervatus]MDF2273127.1 hypothetical protein [Streptomyces coacervatus]
MLHATDERHQHAKTDRISAPMTIRVVRQAPSAPEHRTPSGSLPRNGTTVPGKAAPLPARPFPCP